MNFFNHLLRIGFFIFIMVQVILAQDTTLTVTGDGNVGLGTTNPAAKLHISSDGGFNLPQVEISQTGADGFARLRFKNPSGNVWDIAESSGDQLRFYTGTGSVDIMTMNADGNIGIGMTDPTQKLVVDGYLRVVGSNRLMLGGPFSAEYLYNPDGSSMRIHVGNGDRISISNNGNIGIGTTDPQQKMHVAGGFVRIDGLAGEQAYLGGDGFGGDVQLGSFNSDVSSVALWNIGSATRMNLYTNDIYTYGKVGIGTTNPQGTLDVNGSIYQRGNQLHADYVFEPNYHLESIDEHAKFMWKNKHLKAIPKAAKDNNGREIVEVGSHRRGIVEELEKAHIYIDQLNNRIKALESKLEKLTVMLNENKPLQLPEN